jgi:hypothetical protein
LLVRVIFGSCLPTRCVRSKMSRVANHSLVADISTAARGVSGFAWTRDAVHRESRRWIRGMLGAHVHRANLCQSISVFELWRYGNIRMVPWAGWRRNFVTTQAATSRRAVGIIDGPGRQRTHKSATRCGSHSVGGRPSVVLARRSHPLGTCEPLLKSPRAAVDIAVDNFVDKSAGLRRRGYQLRGSLSWRCWYSRGVCALQRLCFT